MNILVLGRGNIGSLIARLLRETKEHEVYTLDQYAMYKAYINDIIGNISDTLASTLVNKRITAVINCLPHFHTRGVVDICNEKGIHYFDLSEDDDNATYIKQLPNHNAIFMPRCGLAPGLVGSMALDCVYSLHRQGIQVAKILMHCGGIPLEVPTEAPYYARTWSVDGLAREYLANPTVLKNGEKVELWAFSEVQEYTYSLNRPITLEKCATAGGAGNLIDMYWGRPVDVNYYTIRHKGHFNWAKAAAKECSGFCDVIELYARLLEKAIPETTDDRVIVHVSAIGASEKPTASIRFMEVFAEDGRTALARTTATSAVIMILEALKDLSPGYRNSEDVSFKKIKEQPLWTFDTQESNIIEGN